VVSFVSNVRRATEGLFQRLFKSYESSSVAQAASRQAGQLAGQIGSTLQEAGSRASAAAADLRGQGPAVKDMANR
jgi:hypothetical protein